MAEAEPVAKYVVVTSIVDKHIAATSLPAKYLVAVAADWGWGSANFDVYFDNPEMKPSSCCVFEQRRLGPT
jgi:hypothetical protein